MRPDRTTPVLVILALVASLIAGFSVGGSTPIDWVRTLYNAVVSPPPPPATPTPASGTATPEAESLAPTATPPPTRTLRPTATRTRTPEPTATEPPPTELPATETTVPTAPPTEAPAVPTELTVTTLGRVNVRAAPSNEAAILLTLAADTSVTATGRDAAANWVRIRLADSNEGWMTANPQFVTLSGDIATLPVVGSGA